VHVLDEYSVRDPEKRRALRTLWRAMNAEEWQLREARRERKRKAEEDKARRRPGTTPGRKRRRGAEGEDDEEA